MFDFVTKTNEVLRNIIFDHKQQKYNLLSGFIPCSLTI